MLPFSRNKLPKLKSSSTEDTSSFVLCKIWGCHSLRDRSHSFLRGYNLNSVFNYIVFYLENESNPLRSLTSMFRIEIDLIQKKGVKNQNQKTNRFVRVLEMARNQEKQIAELNVATCC